MAVRGISVEVRIFGGKDAATFLLEREEAHGMRRKRRHTLPLRRGQMTLWGKQALL